MQACVSPVCVTKYLNWKRTDACAPHILQRLKSGSLSSILGWAQVTQEGAHPSFSVPAPMGALIKLPTGCSVDIIRDIRGHTFWKKPEKVWFVPMCSRVQDKVDVSWEQSEQLKLAFSAFSLAIMFSISRPWHLIWKPCQVSVPIYLPLIETFILPWNKKLHVCAASFAFSWQPCWVRWM